MSCFYGAGAHSFTGYKNMKKIRGLFVKKVFDWAIGTDTATKWVKHRKTVEHYEPIGTYCIWFGKSNVLRNQILITKNKNIMKKFLEIYPSFAKHENENV